MNKYNLRPVSAYLGARYKINKKIIKKQKPSRNNSLGNLLIK